MNTKKRTAATVALVLVLAAHAGPPGRLEASASDRQISQQEQRMMKVTKRDVRKARREFRVRAGRIAWGNERPGNNTAVIELDPPLLRLGERNAVDIEWFYTRIDNAGGQEAGWRAAQATVRKWLADLERAGLKNEIRFYAHIVSEGPYLDPRWDEARSWYQKFEMGWGRYEWGRKKATLMGSRDAEQILYDRGYKGRRIQSEADVRRAMFLHGGGMFEEWQESLQGPRVRNQMREGNERWAEIARRGAEQYAKAFKGIPWPVILVNGKYLVTANTAGRQGGRRVENVFRTVNWLVDEAMGEIGSEVVQYNKTRFPNQREPQRGELREIEGEMNLEDGIDVEWLYTYVDANGEATDAGTMGRAVQGWNQSLLYDRGGVNLRRTAVINAPGAIGTHQEVHQAMASLFGEESRLRRERVHAWLLDRLGTKPDGLGSYAAAKEELIAKLGMDEAGYERLLEKRELEERTREARRKGRIMNEALGGRRGFVEPVLIVENRYVVVGESIRKTLQTLNWVIARLEAGG